jgi:Malectin domain
LFTTTRTIAGIGNYQGALFRSYRWNNGFTYSISGFTAGKQHSVTLGFAEISQPSCATGKRQFNILANGITVISNLDVFAIVGCMKAHTTNFTTVASAAGKIDLNFKTVPTRGVPFVSFIDVTTT